MSDLNSAIDDFVCRVLRGESAPWSALNPAPDPKVFLLRCQHQGVTSLLYHGMREQEEWPGWPAELRNAMEEASKGQVAQEMLRIHFLKKLLKAFSIAGVPCLLTKGEALANTLYPIPGTRTRADSDLLISIDSISRAREVIVEAGFTVVSPVYKTHQFTVRHASETLNNFEVDVHWRILNAPRYARVMSFEEVMTRSREIPGLERTRTLNVADSLLLACMHRVASAWHDQIRLIWIYDIHLLVSMMSEEQMACFAVSAVNMDVQSACLDGLTKSRACLGTVIPENIIAKLSMPENPLSLTHRYSYSSLGLLVDDWKRLPGAKERYGLLRELFLPTSDSLLEKYGKKMRSWLPVLYLRHIFSSLSDRLTLK